MTRASDGLCSPRRRRGSQSPAQPPACDTSHLPVASGSAAWRRWRTLQQIGGFPGQPTKGRRQNEGLRVGRSRLVSAAAPLPYFSPTLTLSIHSTPYPWCRSPFLPNIPFLSLPPSPSSPVCPFPSPASSHATHNSALHSPDAVDLPRQPFSPLPCQAHFVSRFDAVPLLITPLVAISSYLLTLNSPLNNTLTPRPTLSMLLSPQPPVTFPLYPFHLFPLFPFHPLLVSPFDSAALLITPPPFISPQLSAPLIIPP